MCAANISIEKKHDTNTELLSSVYGEVYLTVNYIAKKE